MSLIMLSDTSTLQDSFLFLTKNGSRGFERSTDIISPTIKALHQEPRQHKFLPDFTTNLTQACLNTDTTKGSAEVGYFGFVVFSRAITCSCK